MHRAGQTMCCKSYVRLAAGSIACAGMCLALVSAEPPSSTAPPWTESVLKEVKLSPEKAQLDPNKWTGGGLYRLDTFQRLWDDWRGIDPAAREAAKNFLDANTFEKLIVAAAPYIDVKLPPSAAPGTVPNRGKETPAEDELIRTIAELHAALNKPLTAEQKKELSTRVKTVPPNVSRASATLLGAMPSALKHRNRSVAKFASPDKLQAAYEKARDLALDYKVDADTLRLMRDVDLAALVQGGREIASAMDRAVAQLKKVPAERFEFAWDTPIGAIALNGTQDNTYGVGPYLLIIDTGGNDRYA